MSAEEVNDMITGGEFKDSEPIAVGETMQRWDSAVTQVGTQVRTSRVLKELAVGGSMESCDEHDENETTSSKRASFGSRVP